ncbi:MAG: hypothetical protein WA705_06580 [Candidatus Ozemobacteraceae bacterium]
MSSRRSHRRGISLFVVLGVLVVVSIFAASMNFLASQTTHKARRIAAQKGAMLIARSARAFALAQIYEGLTDDKSPVYKKLIDKNLTNGQSVPIDIASLTSFAEEFKQGSVDLSVTIESISPLEKDLLARTTGGYDEVEKKATLKIVPKGVVDGVSYSFEEIRQVKIFNLVPGIFGKFSLFVKESDSNYNKFAADIDGKPDDRVLLPHLPVILKNGGELDDGFQLSPTDFDGWKKRGFIYLGKPSAGGPIVLNLTAGNHPQYGENFHFFNIQDKDNPNKMLPAYFETDPGGLLSNPPKDQWQRWDQDENLPYQKDGGVFSEGFAFWIKHQLKGYFSTSDTGDMNADGKLAVSFPYYATPSLPNPKMMSSVLHLFGIRSQPCPTLVLGDVYRGYADYSAIVMEATGDTRHDAVLTYLKESDGSMPSQSPVVTACKGGGLPEGTPVHIDTSKFSCDNLFAGSGGYTEKMCRIQDSEPYLRSHDCLYHCIPTDFFPQSGSFPGPTGELSVTTHTFKLELDPSLKRTAPFFEYGTLADIPVEFLTSKCAFAVGNFEEFVSRFVSGDQLYLDSAVFIKGGKDKEFQLPSGLDVVKGGIVVFEEGNISLGKISPRTDEFLVVVALNGNIEVNSSQLVKASLFAPKGRVTLRNPTDAVNVQGGVVVKNLPAGSFPTGGRISYDTQTDPSGPEYASYYRGVVSNIALSFREIQ